MYPNNGNSASIPPLIQYGSITLSNGLQNDNPTIVLNTREAGIHGTMSSLMQTTILENANKKWSSGFIFSSDASASSYTILNIFGDASNGKALTARVCKGTSQSNTVTSTNCTSAVLKKSSSQKLSIRSEDMIKLWIELSIENKLSITATVENSTATAELDISSFLGSRDEHSRYVGFSISDPSFKIYAVTSLQTTVLKIQQSTVRSRQTTLAGAFPRTKMFLRGSGFRAGLKTTAAK